MIDINPLLRWWVTPKLPDVHIFISESEKPKGFYKTLSVYFRKWLIHPVKRRIAKYYLAFLQKVFGLTVIAITGSAGKTSTKEMVASILRQKGKVVASFANIDPVYNIPTTILSCNPWTKYLVLEMGVEYPGEMDFYLWLATPHIGVITNIYPTHTEFLGSENGVFREKRKLVDALEKGDFAVLNRNNKFLNSLQGELKAKVIWFGQNTKIHPENLNFDLESGTNFTLNIDLNRIRIHLPILGRQFVENALAAASVGYALGVSLGDIKKGVESFSPQEHRMKPLYLSNGALVIDDSYNNNPKAAEESLRAFNEVAGGRDKIVVFGDMLELGSLEEKEHRKIGKMIASAKIHYLIGVGPASKLVVEEARVKTGRKSAVWVDSRDKVVPYLLPVLKRHTVTLIKGSRSIGLDKVVEIIKNEKT